MKETNLLKKANAEAFAKKAMFGEDIELTALLEQKGTEAPGFVELHPNGSALPAVTNEGKAVYVPDLYLPVSAWKEWFRVRNPDFYTSVKDVEVLDLPEPGFPEKRNVVVKATVRLFREEGSEPIQGIGLSEVKDSMTEALVFAQADAVKSCMRSLGYGEGLDWNALHMSENTYVLTDDEGDALGFIPYYGPVYSNGQLIRGGDEPDEPEENTSNEEAVSEPEEPEEEATVTVTVDELEKEPDVQKQEPSSEDILSIEDMVNAYNAEEEKAKGGKDVNAAETDENKSAETMPEPSKPEEPAKEKPEKEVEEKPSKANNSTETSDAEAGEKTFKLIPNSGATKQLQELEGKKIAELDQNIIRMFTRPNSKVGRFIDPDCLAAIKTYAEGGEHHE